MQRNPATGASETELSSGIRDGRWPRSQEEQLISISQAFVARSRWLSVSELITKCVAKCTNVSLKSLANYLQCFIIVVTSIVVVLCGIAAGDRPDWQIQESENMPEIRIQGFLLGNIVHVESPVAMLEQVINKVDMGTIRASTLNELMERVVLTLAIPPWM